MRLSLSESSVCVWPTLTPLVQKERPENGSSKVGLSPLAWLLPAQGIQDIVFVNTAIVGCRYTFCCHFCQVLNGRGKKDLSKCVTFTAGNSIVLTETVVISYKADLITRNGDTAHVHIIGLLLV